MKNIGIALNDYEEISQNSNIHMDKTNLSVTDVTLDFDIEKTFREIAMLKLFEPEMVKKEAK